MSSERYDEQYVEIDGIKVLTYLVPDYDSDNDDIWEYFDGSRPRNKWLDGDLIVDRKHGWIVGDTIEYPSPSFENGQWAMADRGIRWTFVDDYWEGQLDHMDVPQPYEWLLYDRGSGVVTSMLSGEEVPWKAAKQADYVSELTGYVLVEIAPRATYDTHAVIRQIDDCAEQYENTHTPEGYRIFEQDLPLMGHGEYRYFAAQRAGESDEEYAKILAAEYRYAENFGHTWGYYGVVAEWTPPENDLGYGKAESADASVWGVALDFGGDPYADEIRRDVASEVVEHAKAVLADMEEYRRALELEAQQEAEQEEAQARRVFYEGAGL